MRAPLDEMIAVLRESLTQMSKKLDSLLIAAYAVDQADRFETVANIQAAIEQDTVVMEAQVIDVLATQQPVLATDLSMAKGLLIALRQLGHIAREQRDLAELMDRLGINDPQLPLDARALLPEIRQVILESTAAFLNDDRVLAEFTFERIDRLERVLRATPTPEHPPTMVPVAQLHLFALGRILDAARDITRSAPLYRYVNVPA